MAPPMKRKRDESGGDMSSKRPRKEMRKEERQLKKMRRDAFMQHKKVPTSESLEQARETERIIQEKRKKNRDRQKRKRYNRKMKKEEEEQEIRRKEEEVEQINRHDNKILKVLEKKLNIKKDKGLPKSFQADDMAYVLGYLDEAKECMLGNDYSSENEGSDDDDARVKRLVRKKIMQDGDDDDDSEDEEEEEEEEEDVDVGDEEEEGDFDDEDEDDEEEEDEEEEEDDEEEDDEEEEGKEKTSSTGDAKKKVRFNLADEELMTSQKNATDIKSKTIAQAEHQEDIYGRVTGSGGTYVPPAKRKLEVPGGQSNERLNRQVFGILNKLNESNMHHSCGEFDQLFRENSRQSILCALENGLSKLCLTDDACSRSLIVHCCFLVAFLHSKVGSEVSANILQFVVTKFLEVFDKSQDEVTDYDEVDEDSAGMTNKINNCLLLVCQLYDFKIMGSLLILDITKKILERFYVKDINLISLLLKEVGPRLRKEDPSCFKELLQEVMKRTNGISDESSSMKKLLSKNLVDLLAILKNNQLNKIPSYDPEAFTRRIKLLNSIVKTSASVPLKVALEDIEQCETRGKWWLVGSAWSGRSQDAPIVEEETAAEVHDQVLVKSAKEQRMSSGVRSEIFCTMMSAEDYVDSFEKLMKLNLKPEQQHEIMPIIINNCLQGKKFNPFFAHLAAKFCKYQRRFLMACKFSIWDQMKVIPGMQPWKLNNFVKLMKNLLTWNCIPLTVLKNVDFTNMNDKTTQFVDKLLRHLLNKHEQFYGLFRSVSKDESFRELRNSLDFYVRVFYVGKNCDEDAKFVKNANLALEALNEPPLKFKEKPEEEEDFYTKFENDSGASDDD